MVGLQVGDVDLERWALRKGKSEKVLLSLPESTRDAIGSVDRDALGRAPLLARHDPLLAESLSHHQ